MNIYSLRSKSLEYMNIPFFENDDISVFNLLRNVVMNGTDVSLLNNMEDLELYCIGVFDPKEGIIKMKKRKVIDLVEVPDILRMREEVRKVVSNASPSGK